jgi:hypothetical protein
VGNEPAVPLAPIRPGNVTAVTIPATDSPESIKVEWTGPMTR